MVTTRVSPTSNSPPIDPARFVLRPRLTPTSSLGGSGPSDYRDVMVTTSVHETRRVLARLPVLALVLTLGLTGTTPAEAGERVSPAPEDFVVLQYQDFLARSPDPAGLRFWSDRLSDGTHPATLIDQMVGAPEFGQIVAPLSRLYEAYFLRTPDFPGLTFWTDRLRRGARLDDVSAFFADSAEFGARYGALSDTEFVTLVYRNVLGRPPDAAGLRYWVTRLAAGAGRGAIMTGFSESPEYIEATFGRVRATMLYLGMLRRTPDAAGLQYWAQAIDGGTPYRSIVRGFLDSPEYQGRLAALLDYQHPLTGEATARRSTRPALGIKIDGAPAARPQIALGMADVVFEEMVEGNLTRFLAVFHSRTPRAVGPVRSVRTTDFALLEPLNHPLLGASGANRIVLDRLDGRAIVDLNALVADGYYRVADRRSPHNLLVDPSALWRQATPEAGTPPMLFEYRAPGEAPTLGARSAAGVDIDFGRTRVGYRWDARGWVRTQDGRLHTTANGRAISPDNVVVMVTGYRTSSADAESPEAVTIGAQRAWIFTAGSRIDAWWTRAAPTDPIRLVDAEGRDVPLTPGTTWVELAPPGSTRLQ